MAIIRGHLMASILEQWAESVHYVFPGGGWDHDRPGNWWDTPESAADPDDEDGDELALDMASAPDPWQAYKGQRGARKGQVGWKHSETGRVVWGATKPKVRVKPQVSHVQAHIQGLLSDPSKLTPEAVKEAADMLMHMTVKDLGTLKKSLGVKASGVKAQLVEKIKNKVFGGKTVGKTEEPSPKAEQETPSSSVQESTVNDLIEQHPGIVEQATTGEGFFLVKTPENSNLGKDIEALGGAYIGSKVGYLVDPEQANNVGQLLDKYKTGAESAETDESEEPVLDIVGEPTADVASPATDTLAVPTTSTANEATTELLENYPDIATTYSPSPGVTKIGLKIPRLSPAGKELQDTLGASWSNKNQTVNIGQDKATQAAAILEKHGHEPASWPKPHELAGLKQVKNLGGSTGAKLVEDAKGHKFVLKQGASPEHLHEEVAADKLYQALGINVPALKVYDHEGKPAKLAKYIPGQTLKDYLATASHEDRAKVMTEIRKGFVADALLGNWDVVGLSQDNILVGQDGTVHRIDNGGSLRFRAQGGKKTAKQWSEEVAEIDSMRDPKINPSAAAVFTGITQAEIGQQVKDLIGNKQAILAAAPESVRPVLGKRLDWLAKNHLPKETAAKEGAAHLDVKPWKGPKPTKIYTPAEEDLAHPAFKEYADTDARIGFAGVSTTSSPYSDLPMAPASLEQHAQTWKASIPKAQYQACKEYTNGGYDGMNSELRKCPETLDCLNDTNKEWHDKLSKGIAAAGIMAKPITVWRRFDVDQPSDFHAFMEGAAATGDLVKIPGFKSCSTHPRNWHGNIRLEIRARTGAYMEPFSNHKGGLEQEFLQGHNAKYRCLGIKEVKTNHGQTMKVVQLEEVVD